LTTVPGLLPKRLNIPAKKINSMAIKSKDMEANGYGLLVGAKTRFAEGLSVSSYYFMYCRLMAKINNLSPISIAHSKK
jgi:hypothetical protein